MAGILKKLFKTAYDESGHPFCSAIIAAAGSSSRMDGDDKLFIELGGVPIIARTMLRLQESELIDEIIIVTREKSIVPIADLAADYRITKATKILCGGNERSDSVLIGTMEASRLAEYIAVHDGARPLVTRDIIDDTVRAAYKTNAAAPAVPVTDTIKVAKDGVILSTLYRTSLMAVQTPQVFSADILKAALKNVVDKGLTITDDCSAVEQLGMTVALTAGSFENIKVTTPVDVSIAEAILERRGEL